MSDQALPPDAQVRRAAEDAAGMIGQGGFLLYRRSDMSGGEWYSTASSPPMDPDLHIAVMIPEGGVRGSNVKANHVEHHIRLALGRECPECYGYGTDPEGWGCHVCGGRGRFPLPKEQMRGGAA